MKTRKVKGFTLIELIVVIAIIGVLAAILVPTLMTWTMRSKVGSNNATAKTIYTAFQAELTDLEARGITGTAIALSHTDAENDIADAIKGSITGQTKNAAWAVTNGTSDFYVAKAAIFSSNGTNLTGGYPNPAGSKVNCTFADAETEILTWAGDTTASAGTIVGWNVVK